MIYRFKAMNKISICHPFDLNNDNYKLFAYLRQIQKVITTTFGPNGKLKLISQNTININLTYLSKFFIKTFYNFI